jgi:hypothetical protein
MKDDDLEVEYLKIVSSMVLNVSNEVKKLSLILDDLDKREKMKKTKDMIDYCLDIKEDT